MRMTLDRVQLSELVRFHYGSALKATDRDETGPFSVFGANGPVGKHSEQLVDYPTLIVGRKGSVGSVYFASQGGWPIDTTYYTEIIDSHRVSLRYLYYALREAKLDQHTIVTSIPGLNRDTLYRTLIPLPPLSEQKRIADILDKADAIRRKRQEAKKLAATFQQGLFCEMFGDPITNEMNWPVKPFGAMAKNQDGRRKPVKASDRKDVQGEYPYYGASGIIDYVDSYIFDETALLIGEDGANLLARSTPIAFLATGKYWVNNHAHVVIPNGNATLLYLATHLNMRSIRDFVTGSAQPKLNQANLNKIPIPCPPIELQDEFDRRVNVFDKIRAKQTAADKESEDVSCSLVQRAFKGQL